MQSNNYFLERLEAWKDVAIAQANAVGNQRQTPDVQMGSGGGNSANSTQQLMDVWAAKAARDVGTSNKP
jgi:hypothetical protein